MGLEHKDQERRSEGVRVYGGGVDTGEGRGWQA